MNKRPHPGLGLPAKPYTPQQPGPAPPLPAGPPPQQQAQYTPEQQNAHAAAWAAYYQAQGGNAAPQYSAPAPAAAANPYANYGYGGGASHAQSAPSTYNQSYTSGAGYEAPSGGYAAPMQQQGGYTGAPGYTPPAPRPSYNGGGAGYNGYNAGHASPQAAQPYQPPQHGGNQPYYPQSNYNASSSPKVAHSPGGNQPYRPQPGGQQNRPYTPQPGPAGGRAGGGPRPPAAGPPGAGGGFPPAKRPRFDGPGGPGNIPPRPPAGRGPQNAYGSGMARPMGGGGGRGGGAMGSPGNIPRIGFGSSRGGGPGMRGGMGGRGGGPMRGGMMGRGPPMRRDQRDRERDQRDRGRDVRVDRRPGNEPQQQRDRKRKEKLEKEAKTTMTDFRIVGIEVKGLEWTWGLIGEHAVENDEEKGEEEGKEEEGEKKEVEEKPEVKVEEESTAEAAEAKPVVTESADSTDVKTEPQEETAETTETADAVDEKRGEKRKAKPSSVDGDGDQSPKKRSTFAVTHGKANAPDGGPTSSPESNQNRFRIYFESPPELDRVPKAARRNPNKRWRRESSSVAPSRLGEADGYDVSEQHEEEHEHAQNEHADEPDHPEAQPEETPAHPAAPTEAEPPAAPEAAEAATEETAETSTEAAPADAANAESTEAADAPATDGNAEPTAPTTEGTADAADAAPAPAPETSETVEGEAAGDVSMVTAPGDEEAPEGEAADQHGGLTGAEASEAELKAALAESAANAASAYGTRTTTKHQRDRTWSVSSVGSHGESLMGLAADVAQPSVNRVSVLYEDSTRRLVFDASVVSKVRIFRTEGRIEVDLLPVAASKAKPAESEGKSEDAEKADEQELELPKGILVETYDASQQRFIAMSHEQLDQIWNDDADKTLPPLHRMFSSSSNEPITLTVFLNKKKPLSEPKWCRTNQADEWLYEQFGRRAGADGGWRGKLEIMDPDAPPTLASILDSWKSGTSSGSAADRAEFTTSLLASPNELLEILLRLTRGDRNPVASIGTGPSSAYGPLATAIRSDSPYASHQTHVSLAILAMYRLTTDYAEQAGVKTAVLNEKIADIIKSLPTHMIHKSLDGLYKEWLAERKQ